MKFSDLELDLYHSAEVSTGLGQDLMLTEAGIKVEMGRNLQAWLRKDLRHIQGCKLGK